MPILGGAVAKGLAPNKGNASWLEQLRLNENAIQMNSNYVQAAAPQGALTYTSANLGI